MKRVISLFVALVIVRERAVPKGRYTSFSIFTERQCVQMLVQFFTFAKSKIMHSS